MIEDLDVHQGQGLLDAPGNVLVGFRRLRYSARMDVGHDDLGGVVLQGFFDHLPWVDRGAVDGAAEE